MSKEQKLEWDQIPEWEQIPEGIKEVAKQWGYQYSYECAIHILSAIKPIVEKAYRANWTGEDGRDITFDEYWNSLTTKDR